MRKLDSSGRQAGTRQAAPNLKQLSALEVVGLYIQGG